MLFDVAESDWLGSKNYYYNVRTNQISDNINELIDLSHLSFHPEGLCNYLDFGYTAFGQTIVDEIKMLEPNMRVSHESNGKLIIQKLRDPFEELLTKTSNNEETVSAISECINNFVELNDDKLILPLSGGFDSRLIASMVKDKTRVHAFTYGISKNQRNSFEVVYAKAVAEKLRIDWNEIFLEEYPNYLNEWYNLFGVTTHAHGMYHMEFYKKIKSYIDEGVVLSGILGDVFAGHWRFEPINNVQDIRKLHVTHGLCADSKFCLLKNDGNLIRQFYEDNKEKLEDENWRVLSAGRMKMPLLSYLLRTPEQEGYISWSPFLDAYVVAKILTLPWKEKDKRKWQVDYFRDKDLLVGEWGLESDKNNVLDYESFKPYEFDRLEYSCLGDLFDREYIDAINGCIENLCLNDGKHVKELNAWFTIIPLQLMLKG